VFIKVYCWSSLQSKGTSLSQITPKRIQSLKRAEILALFFWVDSYMTKGKKINVYCEITASGHMIHRPSYNHLHSNFSHSDLSIILISYYCINRRN
jgi:hypothetical protein